MSENEGKAGASEGGVRLSEGLGALKRFDCETAGDSWVGCYGKMTEDMDGEWLRFDDVHRYVSWLEAKIKRMQAENGYPTYEDMRTAAEKERKRLLPIVYQWAFPNSKMEQHEDDLQSLREAMERSA